MSLTLIWQGDLKFASDSPDTPIALHSSTPGVVSPMQALAYSVMACMGMDVVHVLQKGRYDMRALSVRFEGARAADHPKRYTAIHLHFEITGNVPDDAVQRALDLSRTTYCSVLNSLREDIEWKITFETNNSQLTTRNLGPS